MEITTWKDLLGKSHQLFGDAKVILINPQATAEERAKIEPMLVDAQALKKQAMDLKSIEDSMDEALPHIQVKAQVRDNPAEPPPAYKRWGEFLYDVWCAMNPNYRGPISPRLAKAYFVDDAPKGHEQKDMSGATGAAGGFLIPSESQATLMNVVSQVSIVRQRATIIPMRRRQIDIPVLDQTGTTAGVPHWFGGLRFYWAEEASQKVESDAAFRQISLIARKLIGYTRVSDELLDDSAISLEAFFQGPLGFAGGVNWMEDYAFLRGNGAGQPLGILNAGATIIEGREVAGTIGFDDLADMMEDFLPSGRGVWVVSQSAMSNMIQMAGPSGFPSYIWQPNARDGIPGSILGFPVIWTEKLPRLGNQGDILLADMSYYLIGDRQATSIESTKFDRWQYDQTSWRVVHRIDGQPWLSAPLALQDGVSEVSPFVILGAAVGS